MTTNANGSSVKVPLYPATAAPRRTKTVTHTNGQSLVRAPALVIPAQELESLVAHLPDTDDQKPTFLRIGSYEWFSPEHKALALAVLRGARASLIGKQTGALVFLLTGLVDLWHKDRATHAAALIHADAPVLYNDLPYHPRGVEQRYNSSTMRYEPSFIRVLTPTQDWYSGIPVDVIANVAAILDQKDMPDAMNTLTFSFVESPSIALGKDPYIYAQYGNWYVKVAEWD